jgi:hypothetical protein
MYTVTEGFQFSSWRVILTPIEESLFAQSSTEEMQSSSKTTEDQKWYTTARFIYSGLSA